MRSRKTFQFFKLFAVLGAVLILACCAMMYLMLDPTLFPKGRGDKLSVQDNQWLHFENRLAKLEEDLSRHHKVISQIKEASDSMRNAAPVSPDELGNRSGSSVGSRKSATCNFNIQKVPNVDIQMLDLYKQLDFENTDGGSWKQGWAIRYDEKQWHPKRKLNVFIVPHSHNDPGWLNTFEKYYTTQTQRILSNMVIKLAEDRRRKFIWAEISFLKMWWDEQSSSTRDLVKRLVLDGQLEIVAGGWVMPDEAVSHWIAQLTQLTQGHQWLKTNLDYVPNSGWAIDPFGLSPTMPYLLKGAGLENVAIQRVHYSVKKRLARGKCLEFRWRQLWDNDGSTEILTHMMPFYSYDVPHTCGPDPQICCQFDFFRLPSFGITCPWKMAPQVITKGNVAKRAMLLLDQYRKKSQLFKTNVVLAPLGDDFRYAQSTEWDAQFENYQRLIDYMNNNEQLNVRVQFGTLTDYFNAIRDEKRNLDEFPTLSGDFFTYADRDDHYWSGYYTSRPFHKRLDRVLLGTLRAAEILVAIGWARGHEHLTEGNLEEKINVARQWHSLFQHHDGVTGTARDNVVADYAQKMLVALNNSAHVIQLSVAHLLRTPRPALNPDNDYFTIDEKRSHHTSVGERYTIELGDGETAQKVVIYNPLPRQRTKVQTLLVSTPYVRVTDRTGRPVQCQISPIWMGPTAMSSVRYELSFIVSVPGFGLTTYLVHSLHGTNLPETVHLANVTLYNTAIQPAVVPGFAHLQIQPSCQEFSIGDRGKLSAAFGKSGFLKALRVGNATFPVHLEFVKYGTRSPNLDRSGAYLFLPDKPEPDLINGMNERIVHLVTGPILSRVFVEFPYGRHTSTLFNSPGADGLGLHILNEVDISETQNFELAMRFNTDIASGDQFFTDLNGLNMARRQRFPKLPTQGNFYPLAASGYIEDKRVRLTVATGQPLGAASMASGQFEIMQDRRLLQDDNRGLSQGVMDNLLTNHAFTLVLERKKTPCATASPSSNNPAGMLSLGGHLASEELLHPMIALHHHRSATGLDLNANFAPLRFDLPPDIAVTSLRVFPVPEGAGKGVGMVLHRQAIDLCWGEESMHKNFHVSESGDINLTKFLSFTEDWTISEAPLTFHNVGPSIKSPIVNVCPHQISSILFHKTQS